ncbi:MAG: lysophospholipid acyltransferase family protein [Geobacteraceae bacterium]|nr:lysophospholipid acyltransferase family protein [Geobacteraceae bacterium]
MSSQKSVERKRGNRLGFWFFRTAARFTGLRGAYGLLYFVCLYYFLVDRGLVIESLPYIKRRFPEKGRFGQLFTLYLLFVSQGKCLVDRFAVAAGYEGIKIDIVGYEKARELIASSEKGMILLTAHIGSWQVAMSALKKFDRHVHVMMRPEDNEAVKDALNLDSESERVRVILTSGALGGVIEALKAIDSGDLVTVMGDRPYDFPAVDARFMGGEVSFPYGAFTLASAAKCPVLVLLSAKVDIDRYVVDVSNVIYPEAVQGARKKDAVKDSVQQYANLLENYVTEHPLQWFVFRNIWK